MSDGFSITVDNLDETMKWFDDIGKEYEQALIEGANRYLQDLQDLIKHNIQSEGLIKSGDLANSVQVEIEGTTVATWDGKVVITVPYAAIHEYGGTIVAKEKKLVFVNSQNGELVFTDRVVIPARPFIAPAVELMYNKLDDYMLDAIKRRGLE